MTRKDYIALANALSIARVQVTAGYTSVVAKRVSTFALDHAIDRVADVLAADNARFERARFLAAAGRTKG